eukprot:s3_g62.t1
MRHIVERVLDQLPARVFLCSRQGAAHLDDVLGQRLGITTEVIGCAWDSRYSLIADLGGMICELRRPRLPELYALLQEGLFSPERWTLEIPEVEEFQENQEDYGFLSVKCFSTDRPNFDSLEQDIPIRDLNRIIENHRRNHPWTWKMVSKRDMKFPEKKGVDEGWLGATKTGGAALTLHNGSSGFTPLLAAASRGLLVTRTLLSRGANRSVVDQQGRSLLHHAASWPLLSLVTSDLPVTLVLRQLLWADAVGDLPLHRALRGGRFVEALQVLQLAKGQDLSVADTVAKSANAAGERMIHLNADLALLEELILLEVDVLALDGHGAWPWHTVAGLVGSVATGTLQRLAVLSQAPLESLDARGRTAMHYAAASGDTENVQWLISQAPPPHRLTARHLRQRPMAFRSDSYYTYAEALTEVMPENEDEKQKPVKKVNSMSMTRVLSGGEDVKLQDGNFRDRHAPGAVKWRHDPFGTPHP